MVRQLTVAALVALLVAGALAACGIKGPLRPAPPESGATTPAATPAPPTNPEARPPLLPSEPPPAIVPPEPAKKPIQ